MTDHSNHKPKRVPIRPMSPAMRSRQYARAVADAAVWESEGWTPEAALLRALQARGLVTAPAPALHPALAAAPELPRAWRIAARDFYAEQRPNAMGTTRAERYLANKRVDLDKRKPMGRPRGSVGVSRRASNPSWWMGPGGER